MQTAAHSVINNWVENALQNAPEPNILIPVIKMTDYEIAYTRKYHVDQRVRAALNLAELERDPSLQSPLFNQTMLAEDFLYHEDEILLIDQEIQRRII